jgi:hypothetical protein
MVARAALDQSIASQSQFALESLNYAALLFLQNVNSQAYIHARNKRVLHQAVHATSLTSGTFVQMFLQRRDHSLR